MFCSFTLRLPFGICVEMGEWGEEGTGEKVSCLMEKTLHISAEIMHHIPTCSDYHKRWNAGSEQTNIFSYGGEVLFDSFSNTVKCWDGLGVHPAVVVSVNRNMEPPLTGKHNMGVGMETGRNHPTGLN